MPLPSSAERTLILAPRGRDAAVARAILCDARLRADICSDLHALVSDLAQGADAAIVTEEAMRGVDMRGLASWVASQPPWSDFPFIVLTEHGGGLERNPAAASLTEALGNVSFLERPFHPTTLERFPFRLTMKSQALCPGKRSRLDLCRISLSESRCPPFREML